MKTSIMFILYCLSSFLFFDLLMQWLFLKLKRKTSIPFKHFHYRKPKIIILWCFCYNLYYIYYMSELYAFYEILFVAVLSFIFIILIQIYGYSKAEINTCLPDKKSIGAYWAYQTYDAYYKIVLEDIKDRMILFEEEHNIHIFCKKLMIINPLSCNAEGTFTERDDAIKEFGTLKEIENDQGANVNRNYKNAVQRISSAEDIYIVAEFSSPMSTLWKSRHDMKDEKIHYIRDCYIKTLKSLVLGSPCIVVEYDDTVAGSETLSSCILSSIKKENNFII